MSRFQQWYEKHERAFVTLNCLFLFPALFVFMLLGAYIFRLFE